MSHALAPPVRRLELANVSRLSTRSEVLFHARCCASISGCFVVVSPIFSFLLRSINLKFARGLAGMCRLKKKKEPPDNVRYSSRRRSRQTRAGKGEGKRRSGEMNRKRQRFMSGNRPDTSLLLAGLPALRHIAANSVAPRRMAACLCRTSYSRTMLLQFERHADLSRTFDNSTERQTVVGILFLASPNLAYSVYRQL